MSNKNILTLLVFVAAAIFVFGFIMGAVVQSYRHSCPPAPAPAHRACLPPVKPVNDSFGATTDALLQTIERLKKCAAE